MDIQHLRTFLHVAELGSLSRAAARLHLSQPALSRQVQLLETELGTPLFARTGRGMQPTEAGALLMRRAAPLLSELDRLADDLRAQDAGLRGPVSLGVPPSYGPGAAAALVQSFTAAHPEVRLRVVVALGSAVREALLAGRLDLGVIYGPLDGRNLHTETLWTESLMLVSKRGSAPVQDGPLSLRQLAELPLILPSGDYGLRRVLEQHSAALGKELRSIVDVDSLQLTLELVRRGVGHCVLPERAAGGDLAAGTLVATPIQRPTPRRTALLAWADDRPLSRVAEALAAAVRTARR